MKTLIAIAAGGALGALSRHFLNGWVSTIQGESSFPWGIAAINISGSFIMGIMVALFAHIWNPSQPMQAFLTVGILGGYTTFSTFSLDAVLLLERGSVGSALFYIAGSVALSIAGLYAGMMIVRTFAT